MGCLSAFAELEVVEQEWTIHGVRAVVNDFVSAFYGVFATEVSDALVGDDYVD